MVIAIASGKGGTGKTTFAVNLAHVLGEAGERVRLLDCDVEEPNDHLFVRPAAAVATAVEVLKPVCDEALCTGCGACAEACNYNAIAVIRGKVLIFNELCHSCGVCSHVCPEKALTEVPAAIGEVRAALEHEPFSFVDGVLTVGEPLAPAVVRKVKELIDDNPGSVNIIDAAPGTACPVVEAVGGVDVVVLVTEPTPFGLNDLKLAVGLTLKLGVPTGIVVNRSDGRDAIIAEYADAVGLPIVGRIPFRRDYAEAYSRGAILADLFPELRDNLLRIHQHIRALQSTTPPVPPPEEQVAMPERTTLLGYTGDAEDYHELTIISGKGGTGKTTVAASFAELADSTVLADNDVDAADLHLLLCPINVEVHGFEGGTKATIDPAECAGCGRCAESCHFDAIKLDGPGNDVVATTYRVDEVACEGCGLCSRVCPLDAITNRRAVNGTWYVSDTEHGPMVHAKLGVAEENSGRLVTQVRNRAAELARELGLERILGDGPPGTGCPVIASVSGADLVLVVTEPTVSGVHDLERVLRLAAHFAVPALVLVNKADLNAEQADRIDMLAQEYGSRVVARIPFDPNVNDALMAGKTVVAHGTGPAAEAIRRAWRALADLTQEVS